MYSGNLIKSENWVKLSRKLWIKFNQKIWAESGTGIQIRAVGVESEWNIESSWIINDEYNWIVKFNPNDKSWFKSEMVNQNLNQKRWVKMNWKSQAKSEIVIQIRNGESNWIGKIEFNSIKKGESTCKLWCQWWCYTVLAAIIFQNKCQWWRWRRSAGLNHAWEVFYVTGP